MKPEQSRLQVTINLDTGGSNYDELKGENFALQALGLSNNEYAP